MPENLWDGMDDAKAAASDASLNASWKLDPERQAKVQALARQMGVAPATADTEFDQLDAMRKREAAAALLEKAPATRQFLTNPDHAAIAHDQTEALARIEQKAKRVPAGSMDLTPRGEVFGFDYLKAFAESPVGNLSSGIVERVPQLAAGLGRTLFGLVDRPADLLASGAEALGVPTIIDFTPQGVKGRMQTAAEKQSLTGGGYAEQAIRSGEGFKTAYKPGTSWEDVKRQPVTKFLPFALEQGIVSAPDMAAAVLALPAYVAARTGEIGGDRATNDQRQEATVEDLFAALPAAAGSAALERLGTRGILGLDDALKGGLKGVPAAVGKASLKEGLTEAGQQVLESLGATVGTKKGVDGAALLDETLAAAAGGAGFGGVVRAGTGTLEAFSGESRKAESAKDDAAKLDDLVQEVSANPLTARDPEAMKAFLDGVTEGEVHIPAKAVMAYLQARRFDDVDAVLDDWGIADQMQEAMAADADIVVDTSAYLSKIAPQHHDAFREDLRIGSGSMSLREAAEFDAGRDDGLQDAAQKVLDQSAAEQEAAAPAEQVYQTLYGQALEAGYVPDVARQYAELWAARYNARAARSPELYGTALDAFNASKVSVRADLPEALKTRIDKIDVVINALRAKATPDAGEALLGPSLLTFVSKQGGIVDAGGELAAMDAGAWHKGKVGQRKIIKDAKDPTDAVNYGAERVAERAYDAGYIAEPTQEALLAAVREELAGRLQFPSDARNQTTQAREDFGQAVDQLDEILGRLGLDVDTATNKQIKAAVEAYAADPQGVMGYEQGPPNPIEGSSEGTAEGNKHGLMPYLRVQSGATIPAGKKPLFAQTTMNSTAMRQIGAIDEVLARHPDATASVENWNAMMADALASPDVPAPPYAFIRNLNGTGAEELLGRLTPGQISDADHGFENAAAFRQDYIAGNISLEDTGRLFLWSFLSRGVSPYTQESLFIDSFDGIGPWIQAAADGTLAQRLPEYRAWAATTAPKGSGQPGSGATHNLNAFGETFLLKMSQGAEDGTGRSRLQVLHDKMCDPEATGKDVRRAFLAMGEGVGIDNKVVSFTLLVAGFTDVMVLDRVQIRELWNDGRFDGVNLYDGFKNDEGQAVAGSALSNLTYGARGLLIYEAIEAGLQNRLADIYTALGRPEAASVGRYHWETWVASSNQEASHATIDAILSAARGQPNPLLGVTAKEGEYGAYAYGARYGRDGGGTPYFLYSVPGAADFQFSVPQFREFLDAIKKPEFKIVPKKFKVTESGNAPWYFRDGVDLAALAALAERIGNRYEPDPIRATHAAAGIDPPVANRLAADQPGAAGQGRAGEGSGNPAGTADPAVTVTSYDQSAYHGSPHVFDRFSTDAIGTGEGAQAYGWGLYFAGRKGIAEYYREALAGYSLAFPDDHPLGGVIYRDEPQLAAAIDQIIEGDGETAATRPETAGETYHQTYGEIIANAVASMDDAVETSDMPRIIREIGANEADNVRRMGRESGNDLSATAQAITFDYDVAAKVFEGLLEAGIQKAKGRLYEVDIPEDGEFLLHDQPFDRQPPKVRAALEKLGIKGPKRPPPIKDPVIAQIVGKALKASAGEDNPKGDVDQVALIIDNDADLYRRASAHAQARGINIEDDGPGAYVEGLARDHLDGLRFAENLTGARIYNDLSRSIAAQAEFKPGVTMDDRGASMALHDVGIAGIKYLDAGSRAAGDGTFNYVVFDDSRVQITSYEQPADGSGMAPRGRIDLMSDGSRIITMFESRDLSTLLHEGGHLWLEELRQDAAMGSAGAMAELDIINDWFAKNGLVDPVDQHEAWARASEAYLMEGKAPSQALKPAFSRFRSWLLSIYRTVAGLNTPINDDIRGVMDRLLATDAEIAAARQSVSADPMFATATEAGMTEAEFTAYNKAVARSKDATHDALLVKVMNAITRERTAEWKAEAEALRPEAVETVDAAPEMRALNWLRSNRQALSREAVIDVLGDASALAMLPKGVPPLISDKAGIHPDSLADVAGYQSGQEMLLGLMSIEAERQAMKAKGDKRSVRAARIDAEVKRIQTERHGDPFTDGSIEREAMDAVHHERQGEVLAEEMRALGRKVGQNPTPLQMLREWARATVAAKKMRDATRTDRYLRAERKAANAAQQAAAKGDNATALKEKQTQTLNHLLYNESTKAAAMAERAVKLFSRYAKARTMKGMDQDYLEQIQGLLEQYDFAPTTLRGADRRASLAAWVKAKQDAGEEVLVPEALLTRAAKTSYVNMTMEELTGLYDAVRSIAHLGRLKQKLLDGKEQRDFEAVIDEVTSQTQDLPTVRDLAIANPKENWGALADAALIKVETMLDWLDRGDVNGVFNRLLIRPATDAANREGQLREKISEALGEHREAVPKAQRKAWLKAWTSPLLLEPRTGQPLKLQRGDLIAMALNVGNASNLDKLARGYGWNPDTILNVLNQNLTKEEWAYVQNVWTTVGSLWPDIAATERKLTGVEPEAVIPQAVVTSFGTIPGGYYPVVYDYERTTEAPEWAAKEAADMFNGVFYSTGTPKGHTQARTGFAAPITLSVSRVLGGHVNKVIKRIAYAEFVMSAKKIIEDGRIRQIIQAKLGPEYYNLLMPWLQRQVVDQVVPSRELAGVEKFVRKGRVNFQIVAMGFRVSTGLAQVAGLTSSAAVIGPEWVAKGMSEAVRMMATDGNFDFVFSRSPEMEQRGRELDRDLRDAMRDFEDGEGLFDPIRRAAFAHIGFMDRYVVAIPTWLGAYNKAKSQHMSEDDASAAADKAVRSSQGSGRAKDLAAIQAPNSELMKLFTLFYSYFNVQYQRQRDIGRMAARGDIVPALNMSFWMLIMAPLAGAIMTGDLPDFEDDEGWLEWAAWKVFGNMWAGVPLVRDVTGYIERKGRGIYTEYSPTPLVGVVGSVEDTLGDIIKLVKDGEPGDRWIKHAIQTPGYFVGLPTGQPSSTVQYLFDMIDGDQNPENVGEFLYGLAKGPQKDQE